MGRANPARLEICLVRTAPPRGGVFSVAVALGARALRELRWRFRSAWNAMPQERHEANEMRRAFRERQLLAEEFARGYLEGWQECFDGWTAAMKGESEERSGWEN